MSTDIVSTVILTIASRAQQSAEVAVLRKGHEMDQAMLQMVDDAMRATPAPTGQGQSVDKRA